MLRITKKSHEKRDPNGKHILDLGRAVEKFKVQYISNTLELAQGDVELAASMLGITNEMILAKMGWDETGEQIQSWIRKKEQSWIRWNDQGTEKE